MFDSLEAQRSTDCLSDLVLDQRRLGLLDSDQLSASDRHLAQCAACGERLRGLEQEANQFLRDHPPKPSEQTARVRRLASTEDVRPGWRRWSAMASALVAAAALALFWLRSPTTDGLHEFSGVRTKGSGGLSYWVYRGQQVFSAEEVEVLHPGDLVRFVFRAPEPTHLAILSLDGDGQAAAYFPGTGSSQAIAPEAEGALPGAVELDGVLGSEQLWAITCAEPFEVESYLQQLRRAGEVRGGARCEVQSLRWLKLAPAER